MTLFSFISYLSLFRSVVQKLAESFLRSCRLQLDDTHMEEIDSVQKFIEMQGWLLLTFFICLHNQLSSFNSVIVEMSEKHDSSSRQ